MLISLSERDENIVDVAEIQHPLRFAQNRDTQTQLASNSLREFPGARDLKSALWY